MYVADVKLHIPEFAKKSLVIKELVPSYMYVYIRMYIGLA